MLVSDSTVRGGVFFAYPGKPDLRAETLREAADLLRAAMVVPCETWEGLDVDGRLIIGRITEAIDRADTLVAEVGTLNSNVFFEVGYALARGKHIRLLLDETDATAIRHWKDLGLLQSVGRIDYGGNAETLVQRLTSMQPEAASERLWDDLVSDARPRDPRSVFYTGVPVKFKAAQDLDRLLSRRRDLVMRSSNGDDLGLAPIKFYAGEIYRSAVGLVHLLAPHRIRADVHNARASLLAGMVRGLDLPLKMIAEEGFAPPLDYQDLLYVYSTSRGLQDHVNSWLDTLPPVDSRLKRPGRLVLKVELPVRDFGQYVAEYEADELEDYFIETGEFASILRGGSAVFVGRKGTGKSANMLRAAS